MGRRHEIGGTITPFLLLRWYVRITNVFDYIWRSILSIFKKGFLGRFQNAVGLLIATTVMNCPPQTIRDVCPNANVTFWLYNNNTIEPYQMSENDISTLKDAPIKPRLPLKVLFHGYGAHRDHDPNPQIRPNYVSIGYNVISIDYSIAVRKPCYPQATAAVRTIGRCIGEFIRLLLKYNENVELEWIHFIAFSLGAHVGMTAGTTLNKMGILIPRLTALDAAAPLFYLDKNFTETRCARFIDAIHTNVGLYGKTERTGDVDFYVNYLLFQRGCKMYDVSCNHLRAPLYFGESIITNIGFWGYPLGKEEHLEVMGEYTPITAMGAYYLSTNDKSPYATGYAFPETIDSIIERFEGQTASAHRKISAFFSSAMNKFEDIVRKILKQLKILREK